MSSYERQERAARIQDFKRGLVAAVEPYVYVPPEDYHGKMDYCPHCGFGFRIELAEGREWREKHRGWCKKKPRDDDA